MPKPNLLMLDKELIFAEFSNIKPVIVINKIDLDKEEADKLYNIYTNVRIQGNKNKLYTKYRDR